MGSFRINNRCSYYSASTMAVMLGLIVMTACGQPPPEESEARPTAVADAEAETGEVSMTTGQGKTMTLTMHTLPDSPSACPGTIPIGFTTRYACSIR